jgi:hypothetical protein
MRRWVAGTLHACVDGSRGWPRLCEPGSVAQSPVAWLQGCVRVDALLSVRGCNGPRRGAPILTAACNRTSRAGLAGCALLHGCMGCASRVAHGVARCTRGRALHTGSRVAHGVARCTRRRALHTASRVAHGVARCTRRRASRRCRLAVGRLAVGRLAVGRLAVGRLAVGRLAVGRLAVGRRG